MGVGLACLLPALGALTALSTCGPPQARVVTAAAVPSQLGRYGGKVKITGKVRARHHLPIEVAVQTTPARRLQRGQPAVFVRLHGQGGHRAESLDGAPHDRFRTGGEQRDLDVGQALLGRPGRTAAANDHDPAGATTTLPVPFSGHRGVAMADRAFSTATCRTGRSTPIPLSTSMISSPTTKPTTAPWASTRNRCTPCLRGNQE